MKYDLTETNRFERKNSIIAHEEMLDKYGIDISKQSEEIQILLSDFIANGASFSVMSLIARLQKQENEEIRREAPLNPEPNQSNLQASIDYGEL